MQHSFTIFRERGKTGEDGGEAEVPLLVPPQLPSPQLLQSLRLGEERGEEEPQNLSHTLIHAHPLIDNLALPGSSTTHLENTNKKVSIYERPTCPQFPLPVKAELAS